MAFGKDQGHLSNVPAYGGNLNQRARAAAARTPRKGGARGGFYWADCYKHPEHTPDIVRVIPGNYEVDVSHDGETIVKEALPYFPHREHHNGTRGCLCSAGPLWRSKKGALPCPSCVIYWEDWAARDAKKKAKDTTKGPNRMGCRDVYAFNIWDYGLYFKKPQLDKNKQFRMNPKTNEPYYTWTKGMVNDPTCAGLESKYGHLLPCAMGETYKETLLEWNKKIGVSCSGCGSVGTIITLMKTCGNPQCGQPIYDPNNCTLTVEQQIQIDDHPFTCQTCQQTNYVNEQIQCTNPQCAQPVKATIFDVDLQWQRQGTKGQQTFLQIFNYSEPRPIQVFDADVLEKIGPLNLAAKFAPTPPELQCQIMNISPQQQQLPQMQAQPPVQAQVQAQPPMHMGGMAPMQMPVQAQVPQAYPQTQAQFMPPQPPQAVEEMPAVSYTHALPPNGNPQQ